jgi:predicted kinase
MTTWVLLAGLPGSGKSTLARALQGRANAVVLDKDRVRETLFPGELTDYSSEQDDLCMRAILAAAAYLTAKKQVGFVLLDGRTFSRKNQIDEVVGAAERAGASWRILLVTCSDAVARERLAREDPQHPAHNRNFFLYREVQRRFEPIELAKLEIDTTSGFAPPIEQICSYLQAGEPS